MVYIWQCHFLHLSHPLLPLLYLQVHSLHLHLHSIFLDSTFMHWYTIFAFLFLTYFALHDRLFHPPHCLWLTTTPLPHFFGIHSNKHLFKWPRSSSCWDPGVGSGHLALPPLTLPWLMFLWRHTYRFLLVFSSEFHLTRSAETDKTEEQVSDRQLSECCSTSRGPGLTMRAGTGEVRRRPGQLRIKARVMAGVLCGRVPLGRGWDPEHTRDSLAFWFPQLPLPAALHLCSCWHPPLWDIQAGDTMVGANLKARGSKTPGSANPHTAWGSPERQRNKCRIIRSKVTLHCDW